MRWITRHMNTPAPPTMMTLVLAVCIVAMCIMSICLVWQAQIIANQREDIRWLTTLKLGG